MAAHMGDVIANPERGEVVVMLEGSPTLLRPTFEALVEIETRTGVGIVPLARRVIGQQIAIGDMAAVVSAGATAGGRPIGYARAGEMILRTGIGDVVPAVLAFLVNALSGGREQKDGASGEAEAAAAAIASPSAATSAPPLA